MQELAQLIGTAIKQLWGFDLVVKVTPNQKGGGDYATSVALEVAGKLKASGAPRPPLEIAAAIIEQLANQTADYQFSSSAPGFINISATGSALRRQISAEATPELAQPYAQQTVVTEFSDPNPFKVLHIGHLYTSIVGDAISNLIETGGGTVHRVNFGGDVGLHVAKTIWAIQQGGRFAEISSADLDARANWLAENYVAGTRAYEADEAAKAAITALNKELFLISTAGENTPNGPDATPDLAQIYWTCRAWSYDYFNAFYARVGVQFEKYYPESTVAALGLRTVLDHPEVYAKSDGATVFVGEPFGLHTRVFVNAAGLPTYEAKDVGLILQKWTDYHFDRSVVITGNDIIEYMKVVLKSVEQFAPELPARTTHLTHGNVKLAGGVKMSSRQGNFVRATEVLELVNAAVKQLGDDAPHEAIALGAIKYAFLKNRLGPDLVFDPKESVSLHGNSGPYLQYSLARAKSILRKLAAACPRVELSLAQVTSAPLARRHSSPEAAPGGSQRAFGSDFAMAKSDSSALEEAAATLSETERQLAVKLLSYPQVFHSAIHSLEPSELCTYLYELAQSFSRFYENNRVIGGENTAFRTALVQKYAATLEQTFQILGIPVLETV